MPGCGRFKEIDFLLFQEGRLPAGHTLLTHLDECDECLTELLELSQVSAAMEYCPDALETVMPMVSVKQKENRILDFFSLGGTLTTLAGAETRDGKAARPNGVSVKVPDLPVQLEIYAEENGVFRLQAESQWLSGQPVEIWNLDHDTLVYSRKSLESSLSVSGLLPGIYELRLNDKIIKLKLDDERKAPHENH